MYTSLARLIYIFKFIFKLIYYLINDRVKLHSSWSLYQSNLSGLWIVPLIYGFWNLLNVIWILLDVLSKQSNYDFHDFPLRYRRYLSKPWASQSSRKESLGFFFLFFFLHFSIIINIKTFQLFFYIYITSITFLLQFK
jgi:hypothetical protein